MSRKINNNPIGRLDAWPIDDLDERGLFADFEAKSNIVGLFDLLLKIDKRVNPKLYVVGNNKHSND